MTSEPTKFVGLHAHTQRSTYDGFGSGDEHVQYCADNGLDAFCLTDHGNMCGLPETEQKVRELNAKGRPFKGIYGVEAYYHPDLKEWAEHKAVADKKRKEEREAAQKAPKASDDDDDGVAVEDEEASKSIDKFLDPVNRRHHLVLLPKSRRGLENIFRLVSRSSREGYYRFPRIDARMLKEHGEDVIASTACVAGVPSYATFSQFPGRTFDQLTPDLLDDPASMDAVLGSIGNEVDRLTDALGVENVFLEIQFNRLAPQHLANRALFEFARMEGMKLVAAADSHYCSPDLWRAREVYKLLGRMGRKGQELGPDSVPSEIGQLKCELYPKNAGQMWGAYREYCGSHAFYNDAVVKEAIENSWHVAHDVIGDVTLDTSVKLPSFGVRLGLTPFATLVELCKEGMRAKLLNGKPAYLARLKTELNVIQKLDNAMYFLTLRALVECAKKECLLGPGRGSGSGCLVNYLLGITYVDPVKDKLIFARFMSLARAKNDLPDVDLDWSDRDHAVKMLKREFGGDKVIPVTNFNALQMKSLVKDVSKLHGVSFEESNDATRNLDQEVKPHLQTGDETKGAVELTYDACREHSPAFAAFMDRHPAIDADVKILGKQPKSLGKHAGGLIVLDDPAGAMPLISVRGELQTPWSEGMAMKGLSPYGLQKMDFLALKTLRVFESCIRRILKRHEKVRNPTFDQVRDFYETRLSPANIDTDDPKVFDHVFRGERFAGVFQFTSPGTQKFVRDLDPRSVDDVAAATAIWRPGPLAAHVDKEYVEARRRDAYKSYGHPLVDDVLRDTRGFIIYQEQIQQVAMSLASFSEDDADRLRKAILKRTTKDVGKSRSTTEELHDKFVAGAARNGYPEAKAEALYEDMRAFAAYGFVKAHAYSYAYVTFQCAWLMTYYEPEWMCSYVESMLGDPDSRRRAIAEVKAMGYEVAKVDINRSGKEWEIAPDGRTFYPSFLTLKGLGLTAINEILVKRPYRRLEDLLWDRDGRWRHSKFNAKAMDALLRVGAFDSVELVGPDRAFETYRQLHHVLIDGQGELKKRLKTDPERHVRRLAELIVEARTLPDWDRDEVVKAHVELFGSVDPDVLLDPTTRASLDQHGIPSIEECQAKGVHWFVLSDVKRKTTRTGRPYLLLSAFGSDGASHRVFVWNSGNAEPTTLRKYACYIAQLKKDRMGFSTTLRDMREVEG